MSDRQASIERARAEAEALREVPLYFKTYGGTFLPADRTLEIADILDSLAAALADAERQRDEAWDERASLWCCTFEDKDAMAAYERERDRRLAAAEAALADTQEALRNIADHKIPTKDEFTMPAVYNGQPTTVKYVRRQDPAAYARAFLAVLEEHAG